MMHLSTQQHVHQQTRCLDHTLVSPARRPWGQVGGKGGRLRSPTPTRWLLRQAAHPPLALRLLHTNKVLL